LTSFPATYQLLAELGERLSLVLDKEFEALAQKNLPLLESLQSQKVELLAEIESSWKKSPDLDKNGSSFEEIRSLIEACREKHIRNDILLRKQIDEVQALIGTLTSQTSGNYGNVYNKLGKIKK
jgi:flagellar biosynthesis/type III secretory pathway chaperone